MDKSRWFCPLMMTLAPITVAAPEPIAQELRIGGRSRVNTVSGLGSHLIETYHASETNE